MPDRELTLLYRSLAGPNGRIQLKEFKAFLSTKNNPKVSARLLKADTTAADDPELTEDLVSTQHNRHNSLISMVVE